MYCVKTLLSVHVKWWHKLTGILNFWHLIAKDRILILHVVVLIDNYLESSNQSVVSYGFICRVQGVKLHLGFEPMCTFNNIQVHCKLIINETVYWLAPSFKDYCYLLLSFIKSRFLFYYYFIFSKLLVHVRVMLSFKQLL